MIKQGNQVDQIPEAITFLSSFTVLSFKGQSKMLIIELKLGENQEGWKFPCSTYVCVCVCTMIYLYMYMYVHVHVPVIDCNKKP